MVEPERRLKGLPEDGSESENFGYGNRADLTGRSALLNGAPCRNRSGDLVLTKNALYH